MNAGLAAQERMMALLDWQQWVLALVTGLISAAAYEALTERRRQKRWAPTRERLIKSCRLECIWLWVVFTKYWRWEGLPPLTSGADPVFAPQLRHLSAMLERGGRGPGVRPDQLSDPEKNLVFNQLPQLRGQAEDIRNALDTLLSKYDHVWSDDDREVLLDARGPLQVLVEWDIPAKVPPAQMPFEVFRALDKTANALQALSRLVEWANKNSPDTPPTKSN